VAAMDQDLEALRARLSAIDRRILELVAERQRVSGDIGARKRTAGFPTRDFAREKVVLDGGRAAAAELGFPPLVAEQLLGLLIRSSLANQEQARVRAEGQGRGLPALVIGGSGKMGRWFNEFLQSQGYAVTVADPAGAVPGFAWVADWRTTPDEFAITVVAAPIAGTAAVLRDLGERRRQGLVFDIASLKSPFASELRALAAAGLQATSVHPMFGPDTDLLSGRHVLFLDAGAAGATAAARQLFASTLAVQTVMPLAEHDRLMAYVLGLSHAVNIAFFSALAGSGEAVPKLAEISSTTFDAQLQVARRVAEESPELYFAIQADNPHGLAVLAELEQAVQRIATSVRDRDPAAFVALMGQGRDYLASRR
jgi:chorismate mutase / prephenate dehydrogenase